MDFDGKAFVHTLTHAPGVYRMYDVTDALLYVGKAKDLKRRVGSYFLRPPMDPRIAAMVAQVHHMDITVTRTEAEALVLESQLIKAQRPHYNIQLRDDKSYPSLRFTVAKAYPRLFVHRGRPEAGSRDFGPFPGAEAVRNSLNTLQKTFKLRNCDETYFSHRSRPCLQYGIGRCSAPCVKLISEPDYREQVDHAIAFLEGRSHTVIDGLIKRMDEASSITDFEAAARWRDRVADLRAVQARMDMRSSPADRDVVACAIAEDVAVVTVMSYREGQSLGAQTHHPHCPLGGQPEEVLAQFIAQHYLGRTVPHELVLSHEPVEREALEAALIAHAEHPVAIRAQVRSERARQLDLAIRNARIALTSRLASREEMLRRRRDLAHMLALPALPKRLECFDISHTQGEATVASCVVFGPDGPEKGSYRRYNIAGITPGDDYAAMHQALLRRFRRLAKGEGEAPDVLLIDGGAGQVEQALSVLAQLGLDHRGIVVVGVAKGPARRAGDEDLIRPGHPPLHPGSASPGLHLVQAVRDEAHRFAITGHRRRRQAARDHSPLESIAGVGPGRRQALLKAFGGWQGVTAAGADELARVPGISRDLAERIYQALHS
jgi:excinuclease ABC subunit C